MNAIGNYRSNRNAFRLSGIEPGGSTTEAELYTVTCIPHLNLSDG